MTEWPQELSIRIARSVSALPRINQILHQLDIVLLRHDRSGLVHGTAEPAPERDQPGQLSVRAAVRVKGIGERGEHRHRHDPQRDRVVDAVGERGRRADAEIGAPLRVVFIRIADGEFVMIPHGILLVNGHGLGVRNFAVDDIAVSGFGDSIETLFPFGEIAEPAAGNGSDQRTGYGGNDDDEQDAERGDDQFADE